MYARVGFFTLTSFSLCLLSLAEFVHAVHAGFGAVQVADAGPGRVRPRHLPLVCSLCLFIGDINTRTQAGGDDACAVVQQQHVPPGRARGVGHARGARGGVYA